MERDDSANALSVIEEGDEQDLNAEAFADMAMSGMDMNLELNALQIDRNGAFSAAVQPTDTHTKRSAYEELKNGAVHYSRREDKMRALQEHPVVASVSTDGRSVSCKCGRSVRLNPPWYILKFEQHVASRNCTFLRQGRPKKRKRMENKETGDEAEQGDADGQEAQGDQADDVEEITGEYSLQSVDAILHKQKPKKRAKTASPAVASDEWKKKKAYKSKKSFPREIRWDVARARGLLPCPGLRDERMDTFVTSAIQLTGGARHRQKIARELFPHLFPDNSEYDHADEADNGQLDHLSTTHKRQPKLQQLLEAEKLLLHDVIEGEALWFVDKDGNSVRSLDCLGVVDSSKGEDRSEFDMQEPYARVLRDLALADIPSALNTWMEMATMGLSGDFDSHSALLGLTEAMVRLKDKEQRGVGLQNMTYTTVTDSAISSESYHLSTIQQARQEIERRSDIAIDTVTGPTYSESLPSAGRGGHEETVDESRDAEEQMESDPGAVAFLSELASPEDKAPSTTDDAVMPTNHVPCTGLRDENVQAYVSNAVQLVGGSRPRYVIARELFPQVFGNDKKVRIVDKLNEEQRLILQDAVFSECLWRVDKEGRCVRSLRCKRFVPATDNHNRGNTQSQGVCRACRDLRTVPNFRSVLSRSKVPKKLENIKYVPSVYTESDPFLRKLSKNSAFRGLYQTVKHMVSPGSGSNSDVDAERLKQVHFWLRFARMGVFGHFKSHPVFEGLMKSMVEMKDKERRGVGKQNMQYSRALDEFMQSMAQISTEAFELFAGQFCGRTLRSQKVKRRSSSTNPPVFTAPTQSSIGAESAPVDDTSGAHQPLPSPTHQHQHYLMPPDDLLSRSLSSEESQRFMDRMLDEVRLSVSREMQLVEEEERRGVGNSGDINEDDSSRLGPETYLDDEGVLTTEI
ncbi:hypothetical protein JG687_00001771 [Phytophthora cactorum]|uniref:Uncharacterized protein n=1 Tax=Phytophthora cactorum TaxID=29920 RepID=A0A8T1UYU5_9STRA|nr:hypothetical protein JG687_00001771 [Phytophthora cactorum]